MNSTPAVKELCVHGNGVDSCPDCDGHYRPNLTISNQNNNKASYCYDCKRYTNECMERCVRVGLPKPVFTYRCKHPRCGTEVSSRGASCSKHGSADKLTEVSKCRTCKAIVTGAKHRCRGPSFGLSASTLKVESRQSTATRATNR